jgi:AcrR family transcriptional regulator
MVRTVGSIGEKTRQAIREAGLDLLYRHGYDGMSLRQLAGEVGLQQGSLYNHISTKQDLLFELITLHMNDLLAELDAAIAGISDPVERLHTFISFHLRYHASKKREVFVCYSELRSLEPANYAAVVALRRRYEDVLTGILEAGIAEGKIETGDARIACFGLLAMLSGILVWYREGGGKSIDEIAAIYTELAFNGLLSTPTKRRDAATNGRRWR